jgi:hypothetical protein
MTDAYVSIRPGAELACCCCQLPQDAMLQILKMGFFNAKLFHITPNASSPMELILNVSYVMSSQK